MSHLLLVHNCHGHLPHHRGEFELTHVRFRAVFLVDVGFEIQTPQVSLTSEQVPFWLFKVPRPFELIVVSPGDKSRPK